MPLAAVDAEYAYTPSVVGADDPTGWSASGLPDGLSMDAETGLISGIPGVAEEGLEVGVTVSTTMGDLEATCDLTVQSRLAVDTSVFDQAPFCLRPGDGALNDVVAVGTGDGSDLRCSHDGASGDGALPSGITVNPDTCEIEGTITEDRYGTWVFIVRGEQNGVSVHAPYCVTQEEEAGYQIRVQHSGLESMGVDATLIPIIGGFDMGPLAVGDATDPLFEITDPASCGANACFNGYAFSINASPFDPASLAFINSTILDDEDTGQPIGFTHGLSVDGGPVGEEFLARPFTVNIGIDYCLADSQGDPGNALDGPCEGTANITSNGDGRFMASILMFPS